MNCRLSADRAVRWLGLLALVILAMAPASHARADAGRVLVFAAASLTDVLTTVSTGYEAESGKRVVVSFAGSSVLARQIEAGSPADIFISADETWMGYLAKRDLVQVASRRDLLGNHLVLIAPKTSAVTLSITPAFPLAAALGNGRLALADPEAVPAGRYARAALTTLGVWDSVSAHLAVAQNVRVALAYVARGETPLGIVYKTDALSEPGVRIVDTFPDATHPAITYPLALTATASADAQAFLDYLQSDAARAVFAKAGFTALAKGD